MGSFKFHILLFPNDQFKNEDGKDGSGIKAVADIKKDIVANKGTNPDDLPIF